jgi:NADPH:quinone reductase-like Zn-dependent oxidoreductase
MRILDLRNIPIWQQVTARMLLGLFRPRKPILGLWLAGEIEAVGRKVMKFKTGDQVYARTPDLKFGAYAEYACLPEKGLIVKKPANLTYPEAVAIPFGGMTAYWFLNKSRLRKGQKILVYGASGSVGTAAVQLAKHYGAEVTGVCGPRHIALVKSLGADQVVDYTREEAAVLGFKFDIVFDAVGKLPQAQSQPLLAPAGRYVSVLTSGHAQMCLEDFEQLTRLAEEGKIKPVIDRVFPLEEMVEAHRYVDMGHKGGNVVVKLTEPPHRTVA